MIDLDDTVREVHGYAKQAVAPSQEPNAYRYASDAPPWTGAIVGQLDWGPPRHVSKEDRHQPASRKSGATRDDR